MNLRNLSSSKFNSAKRIEHGEVQWGGGVQHSRCHPVACSMQLLHAWLHYDTQQTENAEIAAHLAEGLIWVVQLRALAKMLHHPCCPPHPCTCTPVLANLMGLPLHYQLLQAALQANPKTVSNLLSRGPRPDIKHPT